VQEANVVTALVEPNPTIIPRVGRISLGGVDSIQIVQPGGRQAVSTDTLVLDSRGAIATLWINAAPHEPWVIENLPGWLLPSVRSGVGPAEVHFWAFPKQQSGSREATILVSGNPVVVRQAY